MTKTEGSGQPARFCDYFYEMNPVETVVSEFWNGRERVICMGQRGGAVASKQALIRSKVIAVVATQYRYSAMILGKNPDFFGQCSGVDVSDGRCLIFKDFYPP